MVTSLRLFAVLAALGSFLALPGAANADISRHCTGYIGARILSGVEENGKTFFQHGTKALAGVTLEGRGRCRNRLKANDCRRQARDLVIRCGRDLWGLRWSRKVPPSCAASTGGSRPYGRIKSWGSEGISPVIRSQLTGDVKRAVEHSACCVLKPHARKLNFAVYLNVQGDTGCRHDSNLVSGAYKADCRKLRAQGLCGTPRRVTPG